MLNATIHPATGAGTGLSVQVKVAGGGQKIIGRVFGIQAHFNRMAIEWHLFLGDRQRFATGHANLPGHQIEAGDGFSHRMFHLQAGVHFHKEELAAGIQQKLHGAGADITDGLRGFHRRFAHGFSQFGTKAGCRRFFHHLLVATLDRAVALIQIQAVAVLVGKHLNLHMTRLQHVLLHQHARVAKGGQCLALRRLQALDQLRFAFRHLHAFAATAGGGLEQHRVADMGAGGAEGFQVLGFAVVTRYQRHPGFFHQGFGGGFAAHGVDGAGRRAKKHQPGSFDGAGKAGVFREKTVTRVNCLGTAGLGCRDNLVYQQVAVSRLGTAEVDRDIRFTHMPGMAVDGTVYRHGSQAHGLGGTHHAAGDFAAVGHQKSGNHRLLLLPGWFALFQEGMQPFLTFGADANARNGAFG